MHEWIRPRGHDVAVLWSRRSRDAYAAEAAARGETYTFTDAWACPCTWLKGEYAYLAANAASLLLARCNLKHDVVEEADLGDDAARRVSRAPRAERRPPGEGDHRAHRALARRRRSPPGRHGQDELAAAPARVARVHAGAGHRLYGVALAAGFSVRRPRLGGRIRHGLCRPPGEPRRAGAGQPRARRPGGAHGRSDERGHRDGLGARAGHRAHRPDGVCRQPGLRAARRHAPGAPERRGGPALGESHPLGRHDPVLPPARAAGRRPRCPVADAAPVIRHARRRAVVPTRRARDARLQLPRLPDPEPDPRQL